MNQNQFFLALSLILLLLLIGDILISKNHRKRLITLEKVMIGLVIPAVVFCAYSGVDGIIEDERLTNENIYRAYKRVTMDDKKSEDIVRNLKSKGIDNLDVDIVRIMLLNKKGNYQRAEREIAALESKAINKEDKLKINAQKTICLAGMGRVDEAVGVITKNPESGISTNAGDLNNQEYLNQIIDEQAMEIADKYRDKEKSIEFIVQKEELQKKINDYDDLEEARGELNIILAKRPDDIETKKMLLQVEIKREDYDNSVNLAKEIIQQENTLENRINLTNIYAQQAVENLYEPEAASPSAEATEDIGSKVRIYRIERLEEKMEKLNERLNTVHSNENREKLAGDVEEIKAKINELEKEIKLAPLRKVTNYMVANRPFNKSELAPYYLQLAKLQFLINDTEVAKKTLEAFSGVAQSYKGEIETSQAYEALKEAVDQPSYEKVCTAETQQSIQKAVESVGSSVRVAGIGNENLTIDQEFQNYLQSYIKYGGVQIDIKRVDTSRYPDIECRLSIGGDKKGLLSRNIKFVKNDFNIEDTFMNVNDFTVGQNLSNEKNVVLALDVSGSMNGQPLYHSKVAAVSFIESISKDTNIAVVSFSSDATLENSFTNDKALSKNSINSLNSDGGTNIHSALGLALEQLDTTLGKKAIILFTDGRDGSNSDIGQQIEEAQNQGIPVYTIGLGDVDTAYLANIADGTGAKFYNALNANELHSIYDVLQKQIQNDYIIRYRVVNEAEKARYFAIDLTKLKGNGYAEYSLGAEEAEEEETAGEIVEIIPEPESNNIFCLTGIKNSSINIDTLKKDVYIDIMGSGFKGNIKVKIGNRDVKEVKVIDEKNIKVGLPQNIQLGTYSVYGVNEEGKVSVLKDSLSVVNSSTLTELKLGNGYVIKANAITTVNQIDYICKGNVIINDFIRVAGDVTAHKYDDNNGNIVGNSKMYVTFNKNRNKYLSAINKTGEYTVSTSKFDIDVSRDEAILESDGFNTDILFFQSNVGRGRIYKDKIMLTIFSFEFDEDLYDYVEDSKFLKNHKKEKSLLGSNPLFEVGVAKDRGATIKARFSLADLKLPVIKKLGKTTFTVDIDTEIGQLELVGETEFKCIKLLDKIEGFHAKALFNKFLLDEFEIGLDTDIAINSIFKLKGFDVGGKNIAEANRLKQLRKVTAIVSANMGVGPDIKIPLINDEKKFNIVELEEARGEVRLDFRDLLLKANAKLFNQEFADARVRIGDELYIMGRSEFNFDFWGVKFGSKGGTIIEYVEDKGRNSRGMHIQTDGATFYRIPKVAEANGSGMTEMFFMSDVNIFKIQIGFNDKNKLLRLTEKKDKGFFDGRYGIYTN